MKLSVLIRKLREEAGLSLKDVERRSGGRISASYVNHIENEVVDGSSVSLEKINVLGKALGVDPKILVYSALNLKTLPEEEISDLMYEAFGGEKIDVEVLKKAIELIKVTRQK